MLGVSNHDFGLADTAPLDRTGEDTVNQESSTIAIEEMFEMSDFTEAAHSISPLIPA
jgi:hypothetical protein